MRANAKKVKHVAWRPDFRDLKSLPDNKVVRTYFLLNAFAVALFLGLSVFVFINEQGVSVVSVELEHVEALVTQEKPQDFENLKLNGEFNRGIKKFKELDEFLQTSFYVDEFLLILSELQPKESRISSVGYKGFTQKVKRDEKYYNRIIIEGSVMGSKERTGRDILRSFYADLKDSERLESIIVQSDINYYRNSMTGLFEYVFTFDIKGGADKK